MNPNYEKSKKLKCNNPVKYSLSHRFFIQKYAFKVNLSNVQNVRKCDFLNKSSYVK